MRVEDLIQSAKAYEEVAERIKSGEVKVQELREQLDLTIPAIEKAIVIIRKLLNGEDIEGISEVQKTVIKSQIEQEIIDFDYKVHKKNTITLLEMVEAIDKDIKDELFLPYIEKVLNIVVPLLDEIHSDGAKAVRKGIKKFNKKRKENKDSMVEEIE